MSVENTRISAKDIWEIESETDWERVRAMTDEDIETAIADDPDTIDTDEEFWKDAVSCSADEVEQIFSDPTRKEQRRYQEGL
ncbi:UNVERIFIED_CONTAM: hypothetical protein BEN50_03895 [Euhalothece sp. KZN 001]